MTEIKFSKEHEWIKKTDQTVIIGITEFAQEQLGDIVSIEFPQVASSFKQNEVMAIIDSVKASSDIFCPIDGEIIEINQNLTDDAALINQSAEASGWIFKLKISNQSQLNDLMTLVQYEEFLKQE